MNNHMIPDTNITPIDDRAPEFLAAVAYGRLTAAQCAMIARHGMVRVDSHSAATIRSAILSRNAIDTPETVRRVHRCVVAYCKSAFEG